MCERPFEMMGVLLVEVDASGEASIGLELQWSFSVYGGRLLTTATESDAAFKR